MATIAVHQLVKSYNDKAAVKDLSFSVSPGEMLGLIGPNGAGKSSTIKMILDFMKPDSGEIEIFGQPMTEATKNRIGYLPEEKGLYKKLRALDQILYLASLKGMPRAAAEKRAHELLQRTGMLDNKEKRLSICSAGQTQPIHYSAKTGQARLFQTLEVPHPRTWVFGTLSEFNQHGASAMTDGFPLVLLRPGLPGQRGMDHCDSAL